MFYVLLCEYNSMIYLQNFYHGFMDYWCAKDHTLKITFLLEPFATLTFLYFMASKALLLLTKMYILELIIFK